MSKPTTISEQQVTRALDPKLSINEALNVLVEAVDIKSGQKVAILDGTAYGVDGAQGVVRGPSNKGSGFLDVELPNKMTIPIPANLLLPV